MTEHSILFVCLGNICRSPLAEGVMQAEAKRLGLPVKIDSAGTGDWHIGRAPDPRARAAAKRHGMDIEYLKARQVTPEDFMQFDTIYALDQQNLKDLQAIRPEGARAELKLLADEIPGRVGTDIVDPYYSEDDSAFDVTVADVKAAIAAIVNKLHA